MAGSRATAQPTTSNQRQAQPPPRHATTNYLNSTHADSLQTASVKQLEATAEFHRSVRCTTICLLLMPARHRVWFVATNKRQKELLWQTRCWIQERKSQAAANEPPESGTYTYFMKKVFLQSKMYLWVNCNKQTCTYLLFLLNLYAIAYLPRKPFKIVTRKPGSALHFLFL